MDDMISINAAYLGVIATLIVAIYQKANTDEIRFIDYYKNIYNRTLSLRSQLSQITQKELECDFYYEYDIISNSTLIREAVLDYLTEMENFFSFVLKSKYAWKKFKPLLSLNFYQRVAAFYPFIITQRFSNKNNDLFKNYIKAVEKMSKIPKIKNNAKASNKRCYVGVRCSDIAYTSNLFTSNVCIFSNNDTLLPIRINQNIPNKELFPSMKKKLLSIVSNNPEYKFYFYNQMTAYNYPEEILQRSRCINSKDVLDFFNNKRNIKEWFYSCKIPIVPYETFLGKEIQYSKLAQRFHSHKAFVIQTAFGGGGIGTFYADKKNLTTIAKKLQPLQKLLFQSY